MLMAMATTMLMRTRTLLLIFSKLAHKGDICFAEVVIHDQADLYSGGKEGTVKGKDADQEKVK